MKRAHSLAALFLCIALVLSGCASEKDEVLPVSAKSEICTGEGTFGDAGSLTSAQQQIILDYENAYFTSTGNFDIQMPENLFCSETEKDVEKAIWNSTIAVRKAALEDLRLKSYTFKLTVTDTVETESGVNVTLTEENTQQFRGLSVLSEQYKVIHDFSLRHKRVEPTRPKNFIFRILGRFSPCNTGSIDASKKHPTMQKLKFFGCSQF